MGKLRGSAERKVKTVTLSIYEGTAQGTKTINWKNLFIWFLIVATAAALIAFVFLRLSSVGGGNVSPVPPAPNSVPSQGGNITPPLQPTAAIPTSAPSRTLTPSPTIASPTQTPEPKVPQPASFEVIKVLPGELGSRFWERGAEDKYRGKIIQYQGPVQQITEAGKVVALGNFLGTGTVKAVFRKAPATIKQGQIIVVQGELVKIISFEATIELADCVLVPPIKITAEKLYSEFQDNPAAASLKYKIEILEVTGVVNDIKSGGVRLTGEKESAGYAGVRFDFWDQAEKEKIAGLKKGQTVTIRGEFSDWRIAEVILIHSAF